MPGEYDLKREPRIFLCHAGEDKERVKELYHQLSEAGYHPWLDKYDLLPGQNWRAEIKRILSDPYNLVMVCLSCKSVTKRGVVQQEIARALDVLGQMPEDTIYLIPARLEPCDVPRRLTHLRWINLFEPGGFEKLGQALDFELAKRQQPRQPFEPDLIYIPPGEFLMGSDPKKDKNAGSNEQPQHTVYLPDYYIAKTPVTNAQYLLLVQATGRKAPKHWEGGKPSKGKEAHPVVSVTWHDAVAYCQWLAEATGKAYRLPSEAEWEKAARGTDGRIWPWGNEWDVKLCNSIEGGPGETMPVGQYSPGGDSPYDCVDMAGNVYEWTLSLWGKEWSKPDFEYPYKSEDGRENLKAGDEVLRVSRGGSFYDNQWLVRCASRYWGAPDYWNSNFGFRIVVAPGFASEL
jgi:formylglycine-generating enzyme required for sulfatase activity